MRCFVIRVGSSAFALPEDTTISIQDLLLQGIALTTSFKPEFYWKQDSNEDRSMHLEEIEVPELEAEDEPEPEPISVSGGLVGQKVILKVSNNRVTGIEPVPDPTALLAELDGLGNSMKAPDTFDDDIPY